VPPLIAMALSLDRPHVELHQLQTIYSVADLYDLIEVGTVLSRNRRTLQAAAERERDRQRQMAGG